MSQNRDTWADVLGSSILPPKDARHSDNLRELDKLVSQLESWEIGNMGGSGDFGLAKEEVLEEQWLEMEDDPYSFTKPAMLRSSSFLGNDEQALFPSQGPLRNNSQTQRSMQQARTQQQQQLGQMQQQRPAKRRPRSAYQQREVLYQNQPTSPYAQTTRQQYRKPQLQQTPYQNQQNRQTRAQFQTQKYQTQPQVSYQNTRYQNTTTNTVATQPHNQQFLQQTQNYQAQPQVSYQNTNTGQSNFQLQSQQTQNYATQPQQFNQVYAQPTMQTPLYPQATSLQYQKPQNMRHGRSHSMDATSHHGVSHDRERFATMNASPGKSITETRLEEERKKKDLERKFKTIKPVTANQPKTLAGLLSTDEIEFYKQQARKEYEEQKLKNEALLRLRRQVDYEQASGYGGARQVQSEPKIGNSPPDRGSLPDPPTLNRRRDKTVSRMIVGKSGRVICETRKRFWNSGHLNFIVMLEHKVYPVDTDLVLVAVNVNNMSGKIVKHVDIFLHSLNKRNQRKKLLSKKKLKPKPIFPLGAYKNWSGQSELYLPSLVVGMKFEVAVELSIAMHLPARGQVYFKIG